MGSVRALIPLNRSRIHCFARGNAATPEIPGNHTSFSGVGAWDPALKAGTSDRSSVAGKNDLAKFPDRPMAHETPVPKSCYALGDDPSLRKDEHPNSIAKRELKTARLFDFAE